MIYTYIYIYICAFVELPSVFFLPYVGAQFETLVADSQTDDECALEILVVVT